MVKVSSPSHSWIEKPLSGYAMNVVSYIVRSHEPIDETGLGAERSSVAVGEVAS
jgi:hypothetical protein